MSASSGRIAWITGAGSGIGQAVAVELAGAGALVVISGRRSEALEETRALVTAAGGRVEKMPLDVAERKQVAHAAHEILERHGRIDVLVNCAGTNVPKRHWNELALESWERVLGVNLNGAFYCTAAALPAMRARRDGVVINVSSWYGRYDGYLAGPAYNASKHALASMTASLNIEEGVNGIRGCVIFPGEVATAILKARPVPPSTEEEARMLKPADLARIVRFVAEAPPHMCLNEIVVSPTWNRMILGGADLQLAPKTGER
ncbi:MAG: SDR family oxidoreductase [Burkholderiales bacterium]|nr:SDR family oxidoreductase [Burkholderiales bacterium]